jgi:phage-related protein
MARPLRPLLWVASSKRDFQEFPAPVQDEFGFELFLAQTGQHPPSAKLLKGIGSGIVEPVDDFDGDTLTGPYVPHAFKKKSKQGIKTPQREMDLVKKRLRDAEQDYAERSREREK